MAYRVGQAEHADAARYQQKTGKQPRKKEQRLPQSRCGLGHSTSSLEHVRCHGWRTRAPATARHAQERGSVRRGDATVCARGVRKAARLAWASVRQCRAEQRGARPAKPRFAPAVRCDASELGLEGAALDD